MKRLTKPEVDSAVGRYLAGESAKTIGGSFGVSLVTILNRLRQRGVIIRNNSQCQRLYEVDESFFDMIDTESKAYWLGFIAADGNVTGNALALVLAPRDKAHLRRFAKDIRSNHPVKDYKYSYQSFSKLYIKSARLRESLARQGITSNKTFTLTFPTLSPDLTHHFIRGYVDGDGGFYTSRSAYNVPNIFFSVTSNCQFLITLQRWLIEHCSLNETKIDIRHKAQPEIGTLRYGGRRNVTRIVDSLYESATIYLPRKFKKISPHIYP